MPEVYGSAELLVAAVADGAGFTREPFDKNADSLSGSPFESVVIAGVTYVLKHLGRDIDWIMRAFGDGLHGTPPRVVVMWQAGLFETLPDVLDHALVGASFDRDSGRAAILMRDIGSTLVPTGTAAIDLHNTAASSITWQRCTPHSGTSSTPTDLRRRMWPIRGRRPRCQHARRPHSMTTLSPAPSPRAGPSCSKRLPGPTRSRWRWQLIRCPWSRHSLKRHPRSHGDWKFGNLGSHPDGRTVLLDWAWSGRSAGCTDLAWYLAVNCDRLPESKEETVAAYRTSLERRGVATTPWWDRQLELALLGAFVQLGWSKTANPAELAWWTTQVVPVGRRLLQ